MLELNSGIPEAFRYFPGDVPEAALEKGKQDFSMGSDTQGDDGKVDDDDHVTNCSNWQSKTNCTSRAS
jgi:hypothetical protein